MGEVMLAFRFCVVVSAGAIVILGYGVKAPAQELLDTRESHESPSIEELGSRTAISQAVPPVAKADKPTEPLVETTSIDSPGPVENEEISSGSELSLNTHEETLPSPSLSLTPPPDNNAPVDEDEPTDRDLDPLPPSTHPRRENPLEAQQQTTLPSTETPVQRPSRPEPTAIEEVKVSPLISPPTPPEIDPSSVNPDSILQAFKSAIAQQPGVTAATISQAPPNPNKAPEEAEATLIVESTPAEAPNLLEAFREILERSPHIEHAIVTEHPSESKDSVSATVSGAFDRQNFVPFERILNQFRQSASATTVASDSSPIRRVESAIPVPQNLLNPRTLLGAFEQAASQEETPPVETTAAPPVEPAIASVFPDAQTVLAAFERIIEERVNPPAFSIQSNSEIVEVREEVEENSPQEREAEVTPPVETQPNPFPPIEAVFDRVILLEIQGEATTTPLVRDLFTPFATILDRAERFIPSPEQPPEPSQPIPPISPVFPNSQSILAAFTSTLDRLPQPPEEDPTPEIIEPSPNNNAVETIPIADSSNVETIPLFTEEPPSPSFSPKPFVPFARILDRFSRFTPSSEPGETLETAAIAQKTVPVRSLAFLAPEAILEAFQGAMAGTLAQAAEPESPPPAETPESPPPAPPTPQPAAVLEGVDPPEYLNPSANPLLFPTEPDEVAIDISQPITLQQAVELAMQNNPTLRNARIGLESARESLREALAAEYPTLSTQFTFSRTDSAQQELSGFNQFSSLQNILGQNQTDNSTITSSADATLELDYDLYTGGRRSAQITAAEEQIRFNQLEVERLAEQTRFEVVQAYYDLQEADARVEIERAAVAEAGRTLRDAELLEEAGLGTRFDVLRAQVELANSQQNLVNAQSQQETSQRELAVVLGIGQQVEVTAADEIEVAGPWQLTLEETIILAYRNRAELEQQLVQRNISAQQREIALSTLRPQVNLFANYNVLGVLNDNQGLADGYTFGARLRWTLFEGGAAQARAAQEEKNIEQAETQFDEQRNQIRLEVEQAYNSLEANEENIQTASVALQLAEESLRLARLRFSAGVGTQTDVINAQAEYNRAQGNLLTAIISYNQSLAALQRSVSNLPDNRLFDLP